MNDPEKIKRRKRINRLKKILVTSVLIAIILPVSGCSVLLYQVFSLKKQLREAEIFNENLTQTLAQGNFHLGEEDCYFYENDPIEMEEPQTAPEHPDTRKVYLTFDDGPTSTTDEILDILDEYRVKATFFVTGNEAISHPERYQAITERGHTIGMHSYSHDYDEIYSSLQAFETDLNKIKNYITETTGVVPTVYRFPGGSSNTISKLPMSVFCDYMDEKGIAYFDWNVSAKDASNPVRSKAEIVENATKDLERFHTAVILMHDTANKKTTVEALPDIIEYIQKMENTELLPITEDTTEIHHKH